ncbi:MAG: hypothetical protein ACRD1I_02660 [Terriglobia bacterium]
MGSYEVQPGFIRYSMKAVRRGRISAGVEEIMNSESLNLVRAANAELSSFLSEVSDFFPVKGEAVVRLGGVERQLAALSSTIQKVGRSIGASAPIDSLDDASREEVKLYAAHLESLRSFMLSLEAYAEERRNKLVGDTRQISEALAWCNALKLTR